MTKYAADRVNEIKAPSFSELFERKQNYTERTGNRVIDFSIGSSNIPPMDEIKNALSQAVLEDEAYQYSLAPLGSLVKAIQKWYRRRYGVDLEEDEIFALKGSQEALSHIPLATCNPGDLVLIPDPYYPIYGTAPRLAGADIFFMPLLAENGYLINFDSIPEDIADRARLMYVSYPNNPTGAVADDAFYEKLIAFAKKHGILVLHDNAYSELVFDGRPGKSFLSYPGAKEVGFELNSFSKSFSMGGARMAAMVGNREAVAAYKKLMNTIDFGGFPAVQKAAVTALECGDSFAKSVCAEYQRRRDLLIDAFQKAGWHIEPSQATMFVWARIPAHFEDSSVFASELLEKAGVLVNTGTSFGKEGARFVRFALVRSDEEVFEAARRTAQSRILSEQDTF
ncbi:MAG: aminotransferase class I/II-fold pyridoxal phosphate-dependent enzyme [Erysipelotrichaceae bacterium]|nr:aminotransferase class I/II-fold pyridoxal phosphate-dependent enzyme [Erysipelotrichaceae bacterium]